MGLHSLNQTFLDKDQTTYLKQKGSEILQIFVGKNAILNLVTDPSSQKQCSYLCKQNLSNVELNLSQASSNVERSTHCVVVWLLFFMLIQSYSKLGKYAKHTAQRN